jgi:hypothetical protein
MHVTAATFHENIFFNSYKLDFASEGLRGGGVLHRLIIKITAIAAITNICKQSLTMSK